MKASTIILIFLLGSFNIMAAAKDGLVFNFNTPESGKIWVSVNDNVMGGISEGKLKITQDKTLFFYGSLSLANNGGFASIRCLPTQLGLKKNDSIYFEAKGDGREYTMNLYTTKGSLRFLTGNPSRPKTTNGLIYPFHLKNLSQHRLAK